jgi:Transposase DDE domain
MCDSLPAVVDSGASGDGGLQSGVFWRSAAAKKGQRALKQVYARSSATMRQLSDNRAEKVGFTRFFRNANVTTGEILETAAALTAQAAVGRHVLVIQDTSEINYQAKAGRKRQLGRVGNGTDAGLFVHPALAVDAHDGSVLGLAGATIWRRDKVKAADYRELPIEKKESNRWLVTPIAAREALKQGPQGGPALVTVICDRESDIYEFFARVPDEHTHVLVRARHDRALGGKGAKLFGAIAIRPSAGRVEFEMAGRPGRLARKVALTVRFCEVTLPQPRIGADPGDPSQLTLTLVEAKEENPPPGQTPVLWRLLTTHQAASLEDARRIIDCYRLRWTIEQVFRTLKSQGIAIEESFIADGDALECLAATALIGACMVMQLVNGRGEAGRRHRASRLFVPSQIKTIKALIVKYEGKTQKQKNPHPANSLAWAAWCIARLGGWNGYLKERPPGPITFARGLQRFHAIAEGYALATNRKRS